MVGSALADVAKVAGDHGCHVEGEYEAGGGDDAVCAAHGADDAGLDAGTDLFFEA
jgi:hypothetical protein